MRVIELPDQSDFIQMTPSMKRTFLLASIFQCAHLAFIFASSGKVGADKYHKDFDAVLKLSILTEPNQLMIPVNDIGYFRMGLMSLEFCLFQAHSRHAPAGKVSPFAETMRYVGALFKIQKMVSKNKDSLAEIQTFIKRVPQKLSFFDGDFQHASMLAGIASLYLATAGKLSFRLNVKGAEKELRNPQNIDRIRACLFAGMQLAILWRAEGGTRWQLIFRKSAIREDLAQFAKIILQHHQTEKQSS